MTNPSLKLKGVMPGKSGELTKNRPLSARLVRSHPQIGRCEQNQVPALWKS